MDDQERIQAASNFLLQSPPGEINDVLNDIRTIIADDDSLQAGILPALREYNMMQLITMELSESDHQVIISEAARLPDEDGNERFVDPRSKRSFHFDHIRLEAHDIQPFEMTGPSETLRSSLEAATFLYAKNHFYDGVAAVLPSPLTSESSEVKKYIIQIVGNKYNPSNYWSGRWRSSYVLDIENKALDGKIEVDVHYYEQGNVQLATEYTSSTALPSSLCSSITNPSSSSKVLALIEASESSYQQRITDSYHKMADKTFKSLRRMLPLTRQKIDWDKVTGYKLGAELAASKGTFTSGQDVEKID